MTRRAGLAASAAIVASCMSAPPPPAPDTLRKVRVYESPSDPSITEGETLLDIDPDTAYATMSDVPRWPQIFPKVLRVEVTRRDGDDARITLIGPGDHHDNLHFHNRPAARTVWFEDTGGSAEVWAETAFLPGDAPATTRVHTRLFADVHGLASLLAPGDAVRAMRQDRVATDLVNLHDFFARDRPGRAP
jgi:hypothetical protein